jgi:hypothetical protein
MNPRIGRWLKGIPDSDVYWLAGLLEGEGSFLKGPPSEPGRPGIQLAMTDEDVVARVATILNIAYGVVTNRRESRWKAVYYLRLRGERAVEMMRVLRPLMGHRRQNQIDEALATWKPRQPRISRDQAVEIMKAYRDGDTAVALAERYGVTKWSIYAIKQGRYFAA